MQTLVHISWHRSVLIVDTSWTWTTPNNHMRLFNDQIFGSISFHAVCGTSTWLKRNGNHIFGYIKTNWQMNKVWSTMVQNNTSTTVDETQWNIDVQGTCRWGTEENMSCSKRSELVLMFTVFDKFFLNSVGIFYI
jgi:hypothetical protein